MVQRVRGLGSFVLFVALGWGAWSDGALSAHVLGSQEVTARAFLTPAAVGVGQAFVLNVEVIGSQRVDADPAVPDLSAFARYLGAGTSTNMQTVNGRMSVSFTIQYRFQATEEGEFTVGSVSVPVGGQTLTTEPVTLSVSATPPPAPGDSQDNALPGPDDLFVTVEANKRQVVVNEPVVLEYRLFTRVNVESYALTTVPSTAGFWVEEPTAGDSPQVEQVIRDGQQYASAVVRRVIMFPTGVGERTLDPLGVEAQVRVQRRTGDPFRDLFGRGSPFGERVPVTAMSPSIRINVLPVPSANRPRGFTGHVGPLSVTTRLDQAEVATGDAVTFTVEISGEGNLRVLPAPELSFPPEVEVFPPESSSDIRANGRSVSGVRRFNYVLIPRVPGELQLPAVEVPFYDVDEDAFGVARADALALRVTGTSTPAGPTIPGTAPSEVESIREDIRFIHVDSPEFTPVDASPYRGLGFWLLVLLPLLGIGVALGVRRHQSRLEGDVAYARVRRAHRDARRRLSQAERVISGDSRAFYGEVSGALRGFLADKLNLSAANLDPAKARALASDRGASEAALGGFFRLLDQCDYHRFTPPGASDPSPKEVLEEATQLMTALDREVR